MATATISVSVDTRFFHAWLQLVRVVAPLLVPLLGSDRVYRIGASGRFLVRFRVGDRGRWRWYR